MKKTKKQPVLKKNIPDKNATVALVPAYILMPLWFISMALPNLIYSGVNFADTLHILKWTVTGVPVAIAVFIAGIRLLKYGRERINIKIDLFASLWAIILVYCSLQPLWVNIYSPTGYVLEMVCFATVWAFYVISVSSFPEWGLRPILILANLNAAINTGFAELQIRGMNNLEFLRGTIFEDVIQFRNIILPTPGNYIGNTAQQNMFGLWVAVATLGAVYLFVYDIWKTAPDEHGRKIWLPAIELALAVISIKFAITEQSIILAIIAGLFILGAFVSAFFIGNDRRVYFSVFILLLASINFWGLVSSTSRSATLALTGGLIVLLLIAAWKFNRNYVIRFLAVVILLGSVFWTSMYSPRSEAIVDKTIDIVKNAENIGNRRGIWMTSYAMAREHPEGVGIGQYKWHYIEGQRYGFSIQPAEWYRWQYTHWAHNEFLQFFCEGGIIGGILFLLLWVIWFIPAIMALFRRERMSIGINSVWALALISLITFCAVFTRPFHRIENMVWITLAFAISNREFFSERIKFDVIRTKFFTRLVGAVCILSAIAGCVYISSGIYGNCLLRRALSTDDARVQIYLLEEANKHPIVREDVQRNIGHHYIQLGEQLEDNDTLVKGFNILWQQFHREPRSEDIGRLLNIAQKYQIIDVLREIKSYFKPGTYHLQRVPQRNADGQVISALLMVNGPGSDDE